MNMDTEAKMEELKKELEGLINKYSLENKIDMPDFMMAEMLCDYIDHLSHFKKAKDKWFGKGHWDKSPLEVQATSALEKIKAK